MLAPPARPPHAPEPAAPEQLRRLLHADGGFTVRLHCGTPITRGISVAAAPARALSFPLDEWSDDRVATWLTSVRADLAARTACIGGWIDPATHTVWFDVVTVLPVALRPVAVLIGRLRDQRCLFDLGRNRLVPIARRPSLAVR